MSWAALTYNLCVEFVQIQISSVTVGKCHDNMKSSKLDHKLHESVITMGR